MSVLHLILVLVLLGLVSWVVGQLPIDATIAKLIRVVVIVVAVLFVIAALFGGLPSLGGNIRIG